MWLSGRLAWREIIAGWRYFVYVLLCIALGVAAVVGIGLFSAALEHTIAREARALLGGDVEIRLSRPFRHDTRQAVETVAAQIGGTARTHVSELVGMASTTVAGRPGGSLRTQLVELKAVASGYPLYGVVKTIPAAPLEHLLEAHPCESAAAVPCHGAVVQESLLVKLGLAVGASFRIGEARFVATAVLKQEPDRAVSAFSLGPRVLVSQDALAATHLVRPGSRVRERELLRLPTGIGPESIIPQLEASLTSEAARISSFRDAQPQLRRFLDQLSRYLGLIALTALFVGGIGIASTVHAYVRDKLTTIAILKALGADSVTIIQIFLVQAAALGLLGSLVGAALGTGLQFALPGLVARLIPSELVDLAGLRAGLSPRPLLSGVALGCVTTVLFSLWPILGIRDIRPAQVFRHEMQDQGLATWRSDARALVHDRLRLAVAGILGGGLSLVAMWQARSFSVGFLFLGALVVAVLVLMGASRVLLRGLAAAPRASSLLVRYATTNIVRPGSQAVGILVAVGIGVMIVVTISLLERALVDHIGESRPVNAPTFFFIDIQPDQREQFASLLASRWPESRAEFTPLVRSRLHAVNGTVARRRTADGGTESERTREGKGWYWTREYVLTFLDQVPRDNAIVKGSWWKDGVPSATPLVSVEEDAAKHLGLDIGSTVEFDIQGTVVAATVSSIRKVEWNNFSTNFYMIVSPGTLDGAPFTFVATAKVAPDQEMAIQRAVVERFPNVTAINIGEVMGTFAKVLEQLASAIRVVAAFSIVAGAIVMGAALATTRYRRLYESVVLKAIGGTRGLIAGSFAVEYALIGGIAGAIGAVLATVVAKVALRWIFDLPARIEPSVLIVAIALTVVLTLAVGFVATFRILGQRPLAILRHE